jgi:Concanavalin A-like lectin/glucanases superfamily
VQQLYKSGVANAAHSNIGGPALSNGIVGYWTFDGPSLHWTTNTADDVSGNGNTGSLISMSTTTSPVVGKIGQALRFDVNASSDISVPDAGTIDYVQNFSLSAWFKTSSVSADQILLQKTSGGFSCSTANFLLYIQGSSQKVRLCISNSPVTAVLTSQTISPNTWYHVVATADGTNLKMYLNGVLSNQNAQTAATTDTTDVLFIGNNGSNNNLQGRMDDVRVYNRVLSDSEIVQLYNMGR